MSHTTTVRTVALTNPAAIEAAVATLASQGVNVVLKTNAKPRMYYRDQHGVCDYVLHLPDCPYDVGLERQADGSYVPVFDEFGGSVAAHLGATHPVKGAHPAERAIGRFSQEYAVQAAIMAAQAEGYHVADATVDEQGNVHLHINA